MSNSYFQLLDLYPKAGNEKEREILELILKELKEKDISDKNLVSEVITYFDNQNIFWRFFDIFIKNVFNDVFFNEEEKKSWLKLKNSILNILNNKNEYLLVKGKKYNNKEENEKDYEEKFQKKIFESNYLKNNPNSQEDIDYSIIKNIVETRKIDLKKLFLSLEKYQEEDLYYSSFESEKFNFKEYFNSYNIDFWKRLNYFLLKINSEKKKKKWNLMKWKNITIIMLEIILIFINFIVTTKLKLMLLVPEIILVLIFVGLNTKLLNFF
jgi:hypothetical protein